MTMAILNDVKANEQAYDRLRAELESSCWEQWVVIARGRLIASAPTREEALQQAGETPAGALSRLVRKVGEVLPPLARKHGMLRRTLSLCFVFLVLALSSFAQDKNLARSVTIYRDSFGVPHIFGKTDAAVVFGLMYAECEDNFWQLETDFISVNCLDDAQLTIRLATASTVRSSPSSRRVSVRTSQTCKGSARRR